MPIPIPLPTVSTDAISNIGQTGASGGGQVSGGTGGTISARGVCWSITASPTIANSKTVDGTGTGTFLSSLTGLTSETPYYVRAYATNESGTVYGNQVQFQTTGAFVAPTVTTTNISAITNSSASSGGNVTSDGGSAVTARGVCWSTSTNPTIANSKTENGTGTGSFTSSLTSLSLSTTYYVRAYATNAAGTSYGGQVSFQTTGLAVGDLYQGGYVLSLSTPTTGTIVSLADLGTFTAAGAVTACNNYVNTDTGTGVYSDWYLAEIGAIQTMYTNRALLGTFNTDSGTLASNYRSNTSSDAFKQGVNFSNATGNIVSLLSSWECSVRAFRNF
jgi:hypothetical protein